MKLKGKKYIVPYIEGQITDEKNANDQPELAKELGRQGAEVYTVKVGAIVPVNIEEDQIKKSIESEWIIFTSRNGVNSLVRNMQEKNLDIDKLHKANIAAVGKKTAEILEKNGLKADLIPSKQTGRELGKCLLEKLAGAENDNKKVRVTLFGAKETNEELEEMLSKKCIYKKIVCYENELRDNDNSNQETDWESYDGIFFTSASSVRRYMKISNGKLPDTIYSIGPKCSEAIKKETDKKIIEADTSSYEGLLNKIMDKMPY